MRVWIRLGVAAALVLGLMTAGHANAVDSALTTTSGKATTPSRRPVNEEESRRPGGATVRRGTRQGVNEQVKPGTEQAWLESIWTLP